MYTRTYDHIIIPIHNNMHTNIHTYYKLEYSCALLTALVCDAISVYDGECITYLYIIYNCSNINGKRFFTGTAAR